MKTLLMTLTVAGALGAAALSPAQAQRVAGYVGVSGQWQEAGYRHRRAYRRGAYRYRYRNVFRGGRSPYGCYFDEGGGRYYSCDAGGRR